MAGPVRRKASNIFVWIILGLLIVGLAGFGVSSFGGQVQSVGAVGETEVELEAYARALQNELRRQSQASGEPVTMTEARQTGLDRLVLQALFREAALDEAARRAGLSVGDAAVSREVLAIPAFQGPDGAFDRDAYAQTLEQNGLTVAEFEASIRDELARNLLRAAAVSAVTAQPAFAGTIAGYLTEARDITYAAVTRDALQTPPADPSAEAVRRYYDDNPAVFTLPERKRITYAWLTPEMLAEEVEVPEAEVRALYLERADIYDVPERRLVERLVFPDAAAAEAAAGRIAAGEVSFDGLVTDRGLQPADIDLGAVGRQELGPAANAVFAPVEPTVVGPVSTDLGPALFRVNAILAPQTTPFEEVAGELRVELAATEARARIEDEIEALDDLLAGGATLEELAAESAMRTGSIDWTGGPVEDGVGADPEFAEAATAVTEADFPAIGLLSDGGIFALRLDEIAPPELQPFEAVRDEARRAAAEDALLDALGERAATLAGRIAEGAAFEELGLEPVAETGLTRRDLARAGPVLLQRAFDLAEGETAAVDGVDGVRVVRLDAVRMPDPGSGERAAIAAAITEEASQAMARDLLTELSAAVEAEAGVSLNQAAINAVLTQMQ